MIQQGSAKSGSGLSVFLRDVPENFAEIVQ